MDWIYGELDKDVKAHLKQYNEKEDYGTDLEELIETLRECGKIMWESKPDDHRWWYTQEIVVKIDGKFILYPSATSTRDMSAIESGWMMDLSQIRFVKPFEKTIIVYE